METLYYVIMEANWNDPDLMWEKCTQRRYTVQQQIFINYNIISWNTFSIGSKEYQHAWI